MSFYGFPDHQSHRYALTFDHFNHKLDFKVFCSFKALLPFLLRQFYLSIPAKLAKIDLYGTFGTELFPAPEIREISRIRGISGNSTENSTENSVLFSKWLKNTPKSFRMLPNGPKSSRNSTEFLSFFQKSSRKAPTFLEKFTTLRLQL